ncbi:binding-protein-dependent transport systems inner membrane component [Kribbella flavida DSM 17836]|uniref:Binding-protein-dependent transport systems inner membrane component n=1 Tax=Kribbella flavida (strain DSM 17836 / JCM 10339 / NBRC 14399) TaxID=479435 RepID=D2PYW9_KRIFD|nr:ABC transporter permease [Kribbella flavida]ADB31763.1 binding-protein-dependent transport systems inner membrane component [Kribbella flavida DSM 17836]
MLYFVARRLVSALSVVLVTLIATFTLFFVAPTDPAAAICGERNCTAERYNEIKESLHLDRPKVQQFAEYTAGIFVGRTFEASGSTRECAAPCLGYSFKNDQPVTEMLKTRLPVTVSLVAGYAVLVLTIGVFVGSMAAKRRGSLGDRALMSSTLILSSVPYYIVALMISLYFTILYPILPRGGYTPLTDNPAKWFMGFLTPWLVLGLYFCTSYARYSRGSMVETLSEDYIRTARAKGLSDRKVTYKHALRSGLIPVITIFGLDVAGSLAGAIFTERIFDLPGIGNLVLSSLQNYDLPVIMGTVLIASGVLVTMNFLVDIAYSVVDPRVRLA